MTELARMVEYTNLNYTLNTKEVKQVVQTAIDKKYGAVVMPHNCIGIAMKMVQAQKVDTRVATVFGFPFDKYDRSVITALKNDYTDLDVVVPVQLYYYNYPPYLKEIKEFLEEIRQKLPSHKLKLIIESQLMRAKEIQIKELCELANQVNFDVVKTSTGMIKRKEEGGFEELVEDVKLIKKYWGGDIKASGGIRTREQAEKLVAAGATLIGTSKEIV